MRVLPATMIGMLVATAALAVGGAGSASADPPGACTNDGDQLTCTYTTQGEQTFVVPARVSSVQVVARGAAGGGGSGGKGAQVSAQLAVTPQTLLYVEVNVGGGGGAATGGGASDVRSMSAATSDSLSSRLLVAAGGGASGSGSGCPGDNYDYSHSTHIDGGVGGDAGQAGGNAQPCPGYFPARGGGAGSSAGTAGQGGTGENYHGGGGGGGLYGGGGGSASPDTLAGGGGGGGSSLVPENGSLTLTTDPPSVTITYTQTDPTPPVVTPIVDGAKGANGYYVSDVSLAWAVQDDDSTVSKQSDGCSQPVTISQDTTGRAFSCSATSRGGTTTQTITLKRDATAPTVTLAGGPADGASYAAGSVPEAPTCQASDAISGPDTCVVSGYSTDVGPHTVTATATDRAGNPASTSRSYTVTTSPAPTQPAPTQTAPTHPDPTWPAPTHTAPPPPSDTTAPMSTVTSAPGTVPAGRKLISTTATITINDTSGKPAGTINATCWNSNGAVLTLNATDDRSGVASLTYATTTGPDAGSPTTVTSLPVQLNVTRAGITSLSYAAKDKAGNQEATRQQTVVVAPSIPVTCTGPTPTFRTPAHGTVMISTTTNGRTSTTPLWRY